MDEKIYSSSTSFPMVITKCPQRRKRLFKYKEENRIVNKRGGLNVFLYKIPDKGIRYVRDLWNTLVNMRWRWLMLTVALINVVAYFVFAAFFLFDAWVSGDLDDITPDKRCINGVKNFTSYFMLGIETITTTGYGYFHPTENCYLVFIVLTCSTLVTIFIDGAFISVVYVKMTRPARKISYSLFSKKAVINLRNGKLCLIFRINDSIGKHWINNKVQLFIITQKVSKERELLSNYVGELTLQPYCTLFWPIDIVHQIDSDSPLWNVSAHDLLLQKFELVVTLTGSSVLTGQPSISQTSYLNNEILWGYAFASCVSFNKATNQYIVNKKKFDQTIILNSPLCSANRLHNLEKTMVKKSASMNCLY